MIESTTDLQGEQKVTTQTSRSFDDVYWSGRRTAGDVAVPVHVIKVTDADVNAQADGSLHNPSLTKPLCGAVVDEVADTVRLQPNTTDH